MRTGDLIEVLREYGDMPLVIVAPKGDKMVVQKIESRGDGVQTLYVDLGFLNPQPWTDLTGWDQEANQI